MPKEPNLKIVPFQEIPPLVERLSEQKDYSFVTTNGCFDLIHPGHISLLKAAREMGDVLIVGINSDAAIRRLKGTTRPVMNESERLLMLSSLECVDFVTVLEDDEIACPLIAAVHPDVHVKGGEYRGRCNEQSFVEQMGGEMRFVDMAPEMSTSSIVDRIRRMNDGFDVGIICSVRTGNDREYIEEYVRRLEANGVRVFLPFRDTEQEDPSGGIRVCKDNTERLRRCSEIHIIYNPKSQGSLFDIGVAFCLGLPLAVVNPIERTEGKSFQNVLLDWQAGRLTGNVAKHVIPFEMEIDRR